MNHHKKVLAILVVAVHVLVALLLTVTAQLPAFDSSASLVVGSKWLRTLLRWDTFHYAHIAEHGYVYEYEYAFFPGAPLVMRYLARLLDLVNLKSENRPATFLFAGAVASAAVAVDASFALYDLTLFHFRNSSTAYLTTLLSLLSSSPPTLRYVPGTEPFFAYFSYKGMLFCARKQYLRASVAFLLATAFRSNGALLVGYMIWGMIVGPILLGTPNFVICKRNFLQLLLAALQCVVLSLLALLPLLLHQYNAYLVFCTPTALRGAHPRPWCSGTIPLIYSFVQSTYWNVGPFRYWTVQQLPNILIAMPVLALLFYSSIRHVKRSFFPLLRRWFVTQFQHDQVSTSSTSGNAGVSVVADPFLTSSLTPHAIHALILSTTLLVSAHTQITLRFASSLPYTYWAAASLFIRNDSGGEDERKPMTEGRRLNRKKVEVKKGPNRRMAYWWTSWSVLWGALSLIAWGVFLPPA